AADAHALVALYRVTAIDLMDIFPFLFGQTVFFFLISYVLGRKVRNSGWDVNHTRKITQILLFLTPVAQAFFHTPFFNSQVGMTGYLGMSANSNLVILAKNPISSPPDILAELCSVAAMGMVVFLWTFLFSGVIRKRIGFFDTAYASIDRPGDRPRTLLWLRTEIAATYLVILSFLFFSRAADVVLVGKVLMVCLVVSSIGDALSGIIGFRYGRRHYKVRALFTKQEYTRTWEGSACIFMIAAFAISWFFFPHNGGEAALYLTLLAVVPAAMTLAEAKSPHSWDNPFIVLSGIVSISLVLFWFGLISG
ncbi:MAG: hypothetical protein HYU57_00070, partial [Micavibrio aeruginosavorus]|nr:hypothetical protein [Micavibrio aeruginosavorus]